MDPLSEPLRKALFRVLAIVAVTLVVAAGAYHFITAPQRAHVEAVQANADANAATGTMQAAQDALKITVDTQALHGRIDAATKENTDALRHAPGASAPVDASLHLAGLRALCVYDAYHDSIACRAMLNPDPVKPAG